MAPPKGFFKCNNEAAFQKQCATTSWGACCRDDTRAFVLTLTKWGNPVWRVKAWGC